MRDELQKLGDADVQASLVHVAADRATGDSHSAHTLSLDGAPQPGVRFRILRPHAEGGLGQVFVAQDQELNREVALKEIKPLRADEPDSRSRFVLEAEITGGLEHPGIVPVYGLGQYADGRPFYAMRFIRGDSLAEAADRFHKAGQETGSPNFDSVEFRKLLGRFIDVCEAIEYAHSRGVLHRDLKPGNIMLGKYGETLVVDWGLAKASGRDDQHSQSDEQTLHPRTGSGSSATQMGAAIGTPAFMSPEQAAGRLDQLGPASDVYSLGATLYYLLTGQPPFTKGDLGEILRRVQAGEFAPPRAIDLHISKPLEAICLKAMSREQRERYASPKALADDVERFLADEPIQAHAEPVTLRAHRWLRQHPRSITALAATLLLGVVSAIVIAAVVNDRNERLADANTTLSDTNAKLAQSNRAEQQAVAAERFAKAEADEKRLEAEQARDETNQVLDYFVASFRKPDPAADGEKLTVAELLGQATEQLDRTFPSQPIIQAKLLNAIGETYIGLGLFHKAVAVFEQAKTLRHNRLGQDHQDTLTSMNNLATAYRSAGRMDDALPLHEQTLALRKAKLGPEHPDTLMSMFNLANGYWSAGRLDDALPLYEQTLALRKTKLGPEHPDTLSSMNNLASGYWFAGQLNDALPLFEQTLALRKAKLGPEHPDTLTSMGYVALAYQSVGRLDDALSLFEQTLALRKAKLGPEHPDTLTSMGYLALAYQSAGRLNDALPLHEQTLKVMKAKLGPEYPDTLASMSYLALAYQSAGRMDDALPLYEQTLQLMKAKLGPEHPNTIACMNNLGLAYQSAGKLNDALPLFEQSLELAKTKFVSDHPRTLSSMNNLASGYLVAGRLDEALALYEQTLALRKSKLGPEHPDTLSSMNNLAMAYFAAERPREAATLLDEFVAGHRRRAKPDDPAFAGVLVSVSLSLLKHGQSSAAEVYLRECLNIRQQNTPGDWSLFETQSMLGGALAGQKKFAEAEPLLLQGYEGMKQRQATIPPQVKVRLAEAVQRLVDLYTAWDKPEEAAKWKKLLDESTPPTAEANTGTREKAANEKPGCV